PNWDLLPIDDIDQIEVVKGASSVVYGSSAINGAINVRTAWPKENPETKVNAFWGMYSKPFRIYDTPWSGGNPMVYGLTISHSHIFDNYDLSGGISYYNDQGYIRGVPENKAVDTIYNGGTFNKRLKAYFNTRVRSKKDEGLSYGLNGTFYYSENAQNFFWYDNDTNLYRSYPGALSLFKEFSFYMDPFVKYFGKNGSSHALKNRIYYTNSEGTNNQSSIQLTVYNEYQFTHKFKKVKEMTVVAGITNIYSYAYGKVFSGQLSAIDSTPTVGKNGEYNAENFAVYAQIEKKFFNRLTVLFGGRYEYYHLVNLDESKPIFRAGLNFRASNGTFIRASVGQGYRVPSIGERYITTNSGNFGFYPNPLLTSESSISYELGVKQLFKIGKFAGMADLAGFYEDYQHYVEFNFGSWGRNTTDPNKNVGFKFFNTGPARIYGVDATVTGEGKVAKNLDLGIMFGYTYSIPQSTDPTYVYYQDKKNQYTYLFTSSDPRNNILKYRIQTLFKGDVQVTWKKISTGFGGRYFGFMQNIDEFFINYLDDPRYGNPTGLQK
ncbi:MAG: TonB-dependent receptor, partial [Bacteroidota bacterium]